jgi:hypothetical protein
MKTRTGTATILLLLPFGYLNAQGPVGLKAPPTGPPAATQAPMGPQQPAGPINPGVPGTPGTAPLTGNGIPLPDGIVFVNRGSGTLKPLMVTNDDNMVVKYGPKKVDPNEPGGDADYYEPEPDSEFEPGKNPEATGPAVPIPGMNPEMTPGVNPEMNPGQNPEIQNPGTVPEPDVNLENLQQPNAGAPTKAPVKVGPFQIPDKIRTNSITQMQANTPAKGQKPMPQPQPAAPQQKQPTEPQAPVINELEEP